MLLDYNAIASPALFTYPKFKTENGVHYELSHFEQTNDGFVPVYVESEEISDEEALAIMMGVSE